MRGHGEDVARSARERDDPRTLGTCGVREPLDRMAQVTLQRRSRRAELPQGLRAAEPRQLRMVDRMRTDLDAALLEQPQLRPGEEARVAARDPAGDDVRGRVHLQS